MIDDRGAKKLAAAIVIDAVDELTRVYKQAMMIRIKCRAGKLKEYLASKKTGLYRPADAASAERFLRSEWCRALLAMNDIEEIPKDMEQMLDVVVKYYKKCYRCVLDQQEIGEYKKTCDF